MRLSFDRAMALRFAPLLLPLLCLVVSIPLKIYVDAGGPLWLDEGWTLAIVQQKGWAFLRQLTFDPNPPYYFVTLKGWTMLAGLSDGALRTPSVLAAICGPLFALTPGTGLGRRERLLWAALLALWTPGVFFAQEARSYALLFAMECAAAAAFLRVLNRPTLGNAALWSGATALALLTHHHAVIIGGLQGFALLGIKREKALKLWPAALLLVPAFGWMAMHAHRVGEFAKPEFAWYPPMTWSDPPAALDFGFGGRFIWVCGLGLALVGHLWRRMIPSEPSEEEPAPPPWQWAPVACAALGLVLIVVVGFLRPSFTFRYLTPYGPGLVLAVPLALQACARERSAFLGPVVMSFALLTGALVASTSDPEQRRTLQYETASRDLAQAGARHVAFLWDNPTNRVLDPEERQALASAFFQRDKAPVTVQALTTAATDDPAAALYAATRAVGDGYLWVYDLRVPGTAAILHLPRPSPLRPHLACKQYTPDDGPMGVLACRRTALAPAATSPAGPPAPK